MLLSGFMHCTVPWYHVSEQNGEDEIMPKPHEPQTLGWISTMAPGYSLWHSAKMWVRGILGNVVSGNCVVLQTVGKASSFMDKSENPQWPCRPESMIWWSWGGGNSLSQDPGEGSGLRVPTSGSGPAQSLASCVFDLSRFPLWASIFSSIRESPPCLRFYTARFWGGRSIRFPRSHARPGPLPNFEAKIHKEM